MGMLQCESTQRQIAFGRTHNVATNMTGVIEVHDVWGALGGTKQSCGVIATRRCANRPRMTCRVSRVASVCTVLNVCRHTADRTLHNCSTTCRNWCWQSNLLSCSWAWEHGVDSVSQDVHAHTHTARFTAPWEDSPTVSIVEPVQWSWRYREAKEVLG